VTWVTWTNPAPIPLNGASTPEMIPPVVKLSSTWMIPAGVKTASPWRYDRTPVSFLSYSQPREMYPRPREMVAGPCPVVSHTIVIPGSSSIFVSRRTKRRKDGSRITPKPSLLVTTSYYT